MHDAYQHIQELIYGQYVKEYCKQKSETNEADEFVDEF